ncbi:hypothetical protein C1148_00730 [Clostridium botulinum]|nr:hypothetical protein C1148_00730 [Clostridium botulinum]RUT63442.1 hypothetical protein C1149_15110 [Clostridium botulinum]
MDLKTINNKNNIHSKHSKKNQDLKSGFNKMLDYMIF